MRKNMSKIIDILSYDSGHRTEESYDAFVK